MRNPYIVSGPDAASDGQSLDGVGAGRSAAGDSPCPRLGGPARSASGYVLLQATIGNRREQLRGGMFAGVEVVLPTRLEVLAIPLTAVLFAPFGDSVFVRRGR